MELFINENSFTEEKKHLYEVEEKPFGAINMVLVFIGFSSQDTESISYKMIQKICALRIFN